MSFDAHKNFAISTVAGTTSNNGLNPGTGGTSITIATGDGTKFPAVSFNATVWPAGGLPSTTNAEIVRVTAISTDTFTVTRTQESTSARAIVVGDQIAVTVTAKSLTDIENNVWAVSNGGTGQSTGVLGTLTVNSVITANPSPAAVGTFYPCDTSGGAFSVTLPTAPADGSTITIALVKGSNAITINAGGSDVFDVAAGSTSATIDLLFQAETFRYKSSSAIWYRTANRFPKTQLYASFSGDLTVDNSGVVTLANSGLTAGTYSGATSTFAIDAKGRITSQSPNTITIPRFGGLVAMGHSYTQRGGNLQASQTVSNAIDQFTNFTHRVAAAINIPDDEVFLWGRSAAAARSAYTGNSTETNGAGTALGSGPPLQGSGVAIRHIYPNAWFTPGLTNHQAEKGYPALFLLMYGFNELAINYNLFFNASVGDALRMWPYRNGLRTMIARARAKALFASDDASITYTGSGWSSATDKLYYTKGIYHTTTNNTDSFSIQIPTWFTGGTVTVILGANPGADNTANGSGSSSTSLILNDASLFPTGAQTIHLGGVGEVAVTSRSSNTLTLGSAKSWSSGVDVYTSIAGAIVTWSTTDSATGLSSATITNATWSGNVATYTTSAAHHFALGQTVKITGITPSGYNVSPNPAGTTYYGIITAVTSTTFSLAMTSNPGSYTSGGTASLATLISGTGAAGDPGHIAVRFPNLTRADAGKHIVGTLSGLQTGEHLDVDGYVIEDEVDPPQILMVNQYYMLPLSGSLGAIQYESKIDTLNAVLTSLAAEYSSGVTVVDTVTAFSNLYRATMQTAISSNATTTFKITPTSSANCVIDQGSILRVGGNNGFEEVLVTACDKTNGGANDGTWSLTVTRNYTTAPDGKSEALNTTISSGNPIYDQRPHSLDRTHPSDEGHVEIASLCLNAIGGTSQSARQLANSAGYIARRYPKYLDGGYIAAVGGTQTTTTNASVNGQTGQCTGTRVYISEPCVITTLATLTTGTYTGGAKIRTGVYTDGGDRPGALLLDAGQVAVSTAATQVWNVWLPVKPGFYWLVGVFQTSATGGAITVVTDIRNTWQFTRTDQRPFATGADTNGVRLASVTGSLPDPFGTPTVWLAGTGAGQGVMMVTAGISVPVRDQQ